jgi:hypothetical protein
VGCWLSGFAIWAWACDLDFRLEWVVDCCLGLLSLGFFLFLFLFFFFWVAILVGCWLLFGAFGVGLLFNGFGGPITLYQVFKFMILLLLLLLFFHHVF